LFSVLLELQIIQGQYTTTRKEDALDVVANTAAALAVFCFFYILKKAFR
jgi:glycopeptide antibiotics resistance protein